MHTTLRTTRGKKTIPEGVVHGVTHRRLRAMFGTTVVAVILTSALGCDKQAAGAPAIRATSLAGKPTTLFLLFGDRADPRLLPVATVTASQVAPIELDSGGWHAFDRLYFEPGSTISVYRDGVATANGTIRRGMWTEPDPLYKLPGCRSPRPLGALTLVRDPLAPPTVELLASSAPMTAPASRPSPAPADVDSARAFAARAAQRAGLTKSSREELELTVQAIETGATDRPTLVVSYSEKANGRADHPRHVFGLADFGLDGYASTFTHSATDSAPEFRRLIDHLDLTGDGIDEIVLEGWRQGGESFLVIMQFTGGRWREVARGTNSWCADPARR